MRDPAKTQREPKQVAHWLKTKVIGKEIPFEIKSRRKGDPETLIASNLKAKKILGWSPKRGLSEMIKSTYKAYGERE